MKNKFIKILDKLFLVVPALLIAVTVTLFFRHGYRELNIINQIWKKYWHLAYYFYLFAFFLKIVLFLRIKEKGLKPFLGFYKTWFVGFLLAMFSFAISGLILDIGYVILLLIRRT